MINKILSKKGIALNNLVLLITILISLSVGIVILFSSGFAPSMKDSACVVMLRIASIGRGIIVALFDKVFDTVIIIIGVAFSYAVATSLARGGGVGTAILLGVYAVATAAVTSFIYYQISNTYSLIPFFYCGTSEIRVGNLNGKTTATSEDLFKLISERSLDCYAMFGSGKYDPLRGKDPPDPITCFVIEYNITNNFTAKDLIDYMHWYDAVKKVYVNKPSDSYWNKINGRLITINVKKDKTAEMNSFENNFKSNNFSSIGRVFIKYGEDEGKIPYNANYGSEDCHILFKEDLINPLKEFDIDSIDEDYIFLCFQEGIE